MPETAQAKAVTRDLLAWYQEYQRSFVFRGTQDPYRVWLSEIMLQQTRTETAEPYYKRFLDLFPDVHALAAAGQQQVLKAWEGLGYYTRARNLHQTAQLVVQEHGGIFPKTAKALQTLPGIGPYAAAAIASIAYDEPIPAMDGNLTRVISRLFLVQEEVSMPAVKRRLLALGQLLMPAQGAGDMNQALMDLGATICLPGTPDCERCPVVSHCKASQEGCADELPLLPARKPPREVPMAVVLVFCGDKVLLMKRQQALLRGLYVFLLHEGDASLVSAEAAVHKLLPQANGLHAAGTARHIFTHQVWQMQLYTVCTPVCDPVPEGVWAKAEDIISLPLPHAMRAARQLALQLLKG